MEIELSYIVILSLIIVMILFYTYTMYCDNYRYKQIIDAYIDNPKPIIKKKVSFKDPK